MDLAGGKIKPAEGYLAVRFVDDDDEETNEKAEQSSYEGGPQPSAVEYEGCLAVVAAVGSKVSAKVGDTIVTRPYARDGVKIGTGLVLIENYCVLATVT